ncbi:MAG TPA: TetR/AcrR family transcriptional regulator [Ktedonobacterales bacterium]
MSARNPARDGRATDTRERILQVAEQLYYAGGYEHINLQVIADQIGVSKTALFHHFKNKQELFFETLLHMLARYHALFAEALESEGQSLRERLRQIMQGLTQQGSFDMTRFSREEYGLLSPEQQVEVERAWRASLFDVVHRLLEDGVRRGELRQIDVRLSTYVFMHLCLLLPRAGSPLQARLTTTREEEVAASATANRVIDALLDLYLSGVGRAPTASPATEDAH